MTDLLTDADLTVEDERTDTPTDDAEEPLTHGEVKLDLDFAENVEYDVDDGGEGTLYIQYWGEDDD